MYRPPCLTMCFNPSVGMGWFQAKHHRPARLVPVVSIPQSGWGGFRLTENGTDWYDLKVSIPQSGWGGFRHGMRAARHWSRRSFNPSVGMGWFQAFGLVKDGTADIWFQSLSRDGVVSGYADVVLKCEEL